MIFYSLALSFKMSALLILPGVLLIWTLTEGIYKSLLRLVFVILFQITIALPFLAVDPQSYFNAAFDFGRKFEHS
jgi:alpha-1,3-mannosyltransferase